MIMYGYAKQHQYSSNQASQIQVRVPSIHGPYRKEDAKGKLVRNYVEDEDLPWYTSLLLDHDPTDGEVVVLLSTTNSESNTDFIVIGYTGASYSSETE